MPNWSTNFEVNFKRKAYFATLVIDKINFTSQSNLAGRPMVSALQKTQRVSTSTPAPDAVVPPATKSLKTRETLKPPPKFADEFSGLDSNNIKWLTYTVQIFIFLLAYTNMYFSSFIKSLTL